ncbi:MAG: PspC domain-containing protein [Candidatus Promineifilaceae bacterium]|nr:PspC domain-containing protein [Candidatus Promineifilaceae bacterium]
MAEEKKKLYRSNDNRWLAGVCGGIGEYFDLDPTLIRVLFILFSFVVGGGLIIYIILWLVMPLSPEYEGALDDAMASADAAEEETPEELEEPDEPAEPES